MTTNPRHAILDEHDAVAAHSRPWRESVFALTETTDSGSVAGIDIEHDGVRRGSVRNTRGRVCRAA